MAVVLVLGVLVVFTSSATTTVQVSAFVVSAVVLFTAAALIVRFTPYSEKDAWKAPVKVMVLAVTLLSAMVNLVYFESRQVPALNTFADFCAYVLLAVCVLLVLVFFGSFWRALLPFRLASWRHWFAECRRRVFSANLRRRLIRKSVSSGTPSRSIQTECAAQDAGLQSRWQLEIDSEPDHDASEVLVDEEEYLFAVDSVAGSGFESESQSGMNPIAGTGTFADPESGDTKAGTGNGGLGVGSTSTRSHWQPLTSANLKPGQETSGVFSFDVFEWRTGQTQKESRSIVPSARIRWVVLTERVT